MRAKLATLIAAALILTPSGASQPIDFSCTEIRSLNAKASEAAKLGRAIHAEWIEYINAGHATPEQIAIGGTVEWHALWVNNYDAMITSMQLARYSCNG